jgi:predicted Zn-dependent peptidase
LEEAFGKWKSLNTEPPHFPDTEVKGKGSINLIIRENANQTKIRLGHISFKLNGDNPYNKEYVALLVLDQLLGGQAFTSRLKKRFVQNWDFHITSFVCFGHLATIQVYLLFQHPQEVILP